LGAVKTHSEPKRYIEKRIVFLRRAPAFFLKRTSPLYAKPAMQTSVPLPVYFTTRVVNEIICKNPI